MLEGASFLGVQAIINMTLTLLLIGVSWWALQTFKFDLFIRDVEGPRSKLLQIILAIVLGYGTARFFIDYIEWTNWLRYLF